MLELTVYLQIVSCLSYKYTKPRNFSKTITCTRSSLPTDLTACIRVLQDMAATTLPSLIRMVIVKFLMIVVHAHLTGKLGRTPIDSYALLVSKIHL